jgi:hypothetical protein
MIIFSIDNQIKHARAQYEKLSKTNAFNAAFHIWLVKRSFLLILYLN